MLLTIQSDSPSFSFLLHKHPDNVHSQDTNFGQVHVFYPEPTKVALLLEVDPLKLTKRGGGHAFALKPYVNDRSYVASSLFSVALNQMFRTAMAGRCEKRPKLVDHEYKFQVFLPSVPARWLSDSPSRSFRNTPNTSASSRPVLHYTSRRTACRTRST